MRAPIKLNRAFWPRMLTAVLPSADDPRVLLKGKLRDIEFTDAVSTFKFETTYKTTQKARFPLSVRALASLQYQSRPVILDVGASDGTTSMEIMKAVPFQEYYVTDRNMEVFSHSHGNRTYFYAADAKCILIASAAWIIYADMVGALPPFGPLARFLLARAPALGEDAQKINLINPALKTHAPTNVRVQQYDIFEKWPHEKADLIVAANILYRGYFSDERLMQAVGNLTSALKEGGRLAIIENRDIEKATIFRVSAGRAIIERQVNGGTEIEALVLRKPFLLPQREGKDEGG